MMSGMLGGNDRPLYRGTHGQRRGEVGAVAIALHHVDFNRPQGGDVRQRRTGNPAEQHAGENVHIGEPAAKPAYQEPRKLEQAVRHADLAHDLAGHDEQRNRQPDEDVHAGKELVGIDGDHRPHVGFDDEVDQAGRADRENHRAAEDQQGEQGPDANEQRVVGHPALLSANTRATSLTTKAII